MFATILKAFANRLRRKRAKKLRQLDEFSEDEATPRELRGPARSKFNSPALVMTCALLYCLYMTVMTFPVHQSWAFTLFVLVLINLYEARTAARDMFIASYDKTDPRLKWVLVIT